MPLPSFIDSPRFPALLGWEYSVEPMYAVDIVVRSQNRERRNLSATYPRRRITVRIPDDKQADIVYINRFHHAVRGKFIGFRCQDPTDYLSIDLDPYYGVGNPDVSITTPVDQPLGEVPGDPTSFQLIKRYRLTGDLGDLDQILPIYKPVAGTIQIANEIGEVQDPATWDLDATTGIVQGGTGFSGTPSSWGGQFDLPMRFESSLPIDVRNMRIAECSFSLLELRPEEIE